MSKGDNLDIHAHPLLGVWYPDVDTDLYFDEFQFSVIKSGIEVTGYHHSDGEGYFISDVNWTSDTIEFLFYHKGSATNGKIKFKYLEDRKCKIFYSLILRHELKRINGRQLKKESKKLLEHFSKIKNNKYYGGGFIDNMRGLWRLSINREAIVDYSIYLENGILNIHSIDLYDSYDKITENIAIINNSIVFDLYRKAIKERGSCKLVSSWNKDLLSMEYSFSDSGNAYIPTEVKLISRRSLEK